MLWLDAWADAARVEELRATLARYARGWRAALADVLADGARHGSWDCPDPAEAASRIVAVIDGIGLQAMLHPGEVTPERAAGWARRIVELELGIALPEPVPAPPADPPTPFSVRIGVRGRDLDADGSVHPAAMLAYLEEARDGWLAERLGPAGAHTLLARVAVDFRAPLRGQGGEVVVRCALRRPGRSSVVTDETIATAAGEVVARADTTLVAVDAAHAPPARAHRRRNVRRWRDERRALRPARPGSTPRSAASTAQISARARSRGIAGSSQSTRMPKPSHSASTRSAVDAGSAHGAFERLAEPLVQARVEARARLAQLGPPGRPQPQLDPQDEVVAQRSRRRQALVDHRRKLLLAAAADAHVARALVGVLDRLLQQRVARGEVVVHEARGHARVGRDARDAHVVDPLARDPSHRRVEDPLPGAHAPNPIQPARWR